MPVNTSGLKQALGIALSNKYDQAAFECPVRATVSASVGVTSRLLQTLCVTQQVDQTEAIAGDPEALTCCVQLNACTSIQCERAGC